MQPPDRTSDLQHLAGGTGRILHKGTFVGTKDQRFGFQNGLGKTGARCRGEKKPERNGTHVCVSNQPGWTIIAQDGEKFLRCKNYFRSAWEPARQRQDRLPPACPILFGSALTPARPRRSGDGGWYQYLAATGPPQPNL